MLLVIWKFLLQILIQKLLLVLIVKSWNWIGMDTKSVLLSIMFNKEFLADVSFDNFTFKRDYMRFIAVVLTFEIMGNFICRISKKCLFPMALLEYWNE